MISVNQLEIGKWYKLRHRSPGQQYDRKSVMQYLGVDDASVEFPPVRLVFNARPFAGTQTFPASWIISAEEVPSNTHPFIGARWKI